MSYSIRRISSGASVFVMLAASAVGIAQTAAPARETPRPQDIDPAVNTSAPASDTGNTSPSASTGAATDASAARPTASGAAGDGTSGAAPTTGKASTATPGKPGRPTAVTPGARSATTADGKPKGKAQDRLELDTTQITGNRELPKVLYIVPWKRSDLGDLVGKPVNSLLDEVLTPVDRDVFRRENRYYRALKPAESGSAGASAAPVAGAAPGSGTSSGSDAPAAGDER